MQIKSVIKLTKTGKLLFLAGLLVFLSSSGCATTAGEFTLDRYGEGREPIVWPHKPEKPRYRYAGQLTGEDNFIKSGGSTLKNVFQWVIGVITGERVPILLQRPQMGAVDELRKRVYVSDVGRGAVFVFDEAKGQLYVWEMAEPMLRFKSPIGIAVGKNGDIYVADSELGLIFHLDSNGKPIGVIGKNRLIRPTGLARDPDRGLLYVADSHAHNIKIFTDDGVFIKSISKRGEEEGSLNFPTHLAFSNGKLYVSDTLNARVQIFDGDGGFLGTFGRRGLYVGNFTLPKGVAVDGDGNIYVIEAYYDHLLVFREDGQFLLPIGGTGSGFGTFYLPSGVWTDSRERIYVSDMFNRRVVVFQYLGDG